MAQDYPEIRRLIEMAQNLPEISEFLRPWLELYWARQARRVGGVPPPSLDYLESDYLMMVIVKEIINSTLFTFVWRGQTLIGRAISGTASLSVGDTVLVRKLSASSEYIHIVWPVEAEIVLYSVPVADDPNRSHQSELWKYDGTDHTLLYTTVGALGGFGIGSITCIFYVPTAGLAYFAVHTVFDDGTDWRETNELYKLDLATSIVTDLNLSASIDNDPDAPPFEFTLSPPIMEAAYFKGNVYLGQAGTNQAISGNFSARVYRFNTTAETLTRVFIFPVTTNRHPSNASLAVYGSDYRIFFSAKNDSPVGGGKIYESADGTTWTELQDLGDAAYLTTMMTDRTTKNVYLYRNFPRGIMVYAGVSFALDFVWPSLLQQPNFGANYVGAVRTRLWAINRVAHITVDEVYQNIGAGWGADSVQPPGTWGWQETGQTIASIQNEPLFLSPGIPDQQLFRRQAGVWLVAKSYGRTAAQNAYGINGAICRARTAVLPHEQ